MPGITDDEHLKVPATSQPDNSPGVISPTTETVNPQQEIENMEVHKHPHHVTHKKKWGEYLLEFSMLFLAVFLGFVAENIREGVVESHREKEYIKSFYEDLTADETDLQRIINNLNIESQMGDSLATLMHNVSKETPANFIYMYLVRITRSASTNLYANDRTIVQLRNAGGMRLIHNKGVSDSMVAYYKEIETIHFLYDESITMKRALREKYSTILNADDFRKAHGKTTEIINPAETVYLRTADSDAINDCLIRVLNIKSLSGGLSLRIQRLKDRATLIKTFIGKEYQLKNE
ncbi:MAG: hypothetical protein JWN76_3270 [Chitinophagaceae bacterium]|nr:hypothetical protein [Chitinophagaceae bacterium]